MKIFKFFKRSSKSKASFSDFFLHASKEEKIRVFTEAAKRANKDQRELIESIKEAEHKTT